MEMLKRFEPITLVVIVLGALNWGMVGLFHENVLADVFGHGTLTDVVYTVIGVSGLIYVPKVLEMLHIGAGPHPRGV
jgi:uncharacterized protein